MKNRTLSRHWLLLAALAALAAALYTLPRVINLHGAFQNISGAIAEALVVAVVVAIAVEPHLLRYFGKELESFGEELATQTFWASFYSRAPEPYRKAIQELASEEQFSTEANFRVTMDWADNKKSIVCLAVELVNHRENHGVTPYRLRASSFVFESHFPRYAAEFQQYSVICHDTNLYVDFLKTGSLKVEKAQDGRLLLQSQTSEADSPQFSIPPGGRYTIVTRTVTYLAPIGYFPLIIVRPALRFTVQFFGSALADLHIAWLNSGSSRHRTTVNPLVERNEGNGAALAERGPIQIGDVFITGQTVLISWKSQHVGTGHVPDGPPKSARQSDSTTTSRSKKAAMPLPVQPQSARRVR